MTGPAMVNIFAPTPRMKPSVFESIAALDTAFAKPVMGTSVPAPAICAILSNTPNPVRITAIRISVSDVRHPASILSSPSESLYSLQRKCPTVQMQPPIRNAAVQFLKIGDFAALSSAYFLYFSFVRVSDETKPKKREKNYLKKNL